MSQVTDPSTWTKFFDEHGLANTLVVAVVTSFLAFMWYLRPLMKRLLEAKIDESAASAHQHKTLADTLPRIFGKVKGIADDTSEIKGIGKTVNEIHDAVVKKGGA